MGKIMREPYELKVTSTPMLGWPTINILCDETVIRTVTTPLNIAEELVELLNQAFQNGYIEGKGGL